MAERQAFLMVADEIYFNLYGKAILQGIYQTDLAIGSDPSQIPQLVFFFVMETDISDPFHSLAVEVGLPGNEVIRNQVVVYPPEFIKSVAEANPERTRFTLRHPMLVPGPMLRPGKIQAKVVHEKGEIQLSAPWIVYNAPAKPN